MAHTWRTAMIFMLVASATTIIMFWLVAVGPSPPARAATSAAATVRDSRAAVQPPPGPGPGSTSPVAGVLPSPTPADPITPSAHAKQGGLTRPADRIRRTPTASSPPTQVTPIDPAPHDPLGPGPATPVDPATPSPATPGPDALATPTPGGPTWPMETGHASQADPGRNADRAPGPARTALAGPPAGDASAASVPQAAASADGAAPVGPDPRGNRLIIAGLAGLVASVSGLVAIAVRRRQW